MKKLKILIAAGLIVYIFTFYGCSNTKNISNEQVTDSASIRRMIESQNFVFVAEYVNPIGVSRRILTANQYDISITKDSIESYLPYFGRGYTAPLSPSDVDFTFTSTKFSYAVIPTRKGWNVLIKTTDQTYLQQLFFTIFSNGSVSLNITSLDKSSLSYDGFIAARKVKK
jgi:hypothetical protein